MAMKQDAQSAGKPNKLNSVVMDAIKNGRESTALFMLDAPGVDRNYADEDGTLLAQAKWNGLKKVAAKLEEPAVQNKRDSMLMDAIKNGRESTAVFMLSTPGLNLNHADEDGTLLAQAKWNGLKKVVEKLEAQGASLDRNEGAFYTATPLVSPYKMMTFPKLKQPEVFSAEMTPQPVNLHEPLTAVRKIGDFLGGLVGKPPSRILEADFSSEVYPDFSKPNLDEPLSLTRRMGGFFRKVLGMPAWSAPETAPALDDASASTTMRVAALPFPTPATTTEKIRGFLRKTFGRTADRVAQPNLSLDTQGVHPSTPQP